MTEKEQKARVGRFGWTAAIGNIILSFVFSGVCASRIWWEMQFMSMRAPVAYVMAGLYFVQSVYFSVRLLSDPHLSASVYRPMRWSAMILEIAGAVVGLQDILFTFLSERFSEDEKIFKCVMDVIFFLGVPVLQLVYHSAVLNALEERETSRGMSKESWVLPWIVESRKETV